MVRGVLALFRRGATYLWHSDRRLRLLAIGSLLSLNSILIVPLLCVVTASPACLLAAAPTTFLKSGYIVRALRRTVHGDDDPPSFDRWKALFREGAKVSVIRVGYLSLPALLFQGSTQPGQALTRLIGFLFVGPLGSTMIEIGSTVVAESERGTGLLASYEPLLVMLVVLYIYPAAVARYVATGSVASSFRIDKLRSALLTGTYLRGWIPFAVAWFVSVAGFLVWVVVWLGYLLVVIILYVFVAIIAGIFGATPDFDPPSFASFLFELLQEPGFLSVFLLTLLVGTVANFYFGVGAYHIIGRVWTNLGGAARSSA